MGTMRIILSFAILLTGCYSHEVIENNAIPTPNLDDVELTFELHDGSSIISLAGERHSRIEGGYRVVGKMNSNQLWNVTKDFDGIVRDDQINEVVSTELNVVMTVVGLGLAGLLIAGVIAGVVGVADATHWKK